MEELNKQTYKKFEHPQITAKGEKRAWVSLTSLKTLWFNTGTRCNLTCENCYIESSPTNDRLDYITAAEVQSYLDEIKSESYPVERIGLTGGEPFLNPDIIKMLTAILENKIPVLVLTNAYKVLKRHENQLLELQKKYGELLQLRVSLDHYTKKIHERERGDKTFDETLANIKWLYDRGFHLSLAGRSLTHESHDDAFSGYQNLLREYTIDWKLKADHLVIFPEMIAGEDVPEITTACWDILKKTPEMQMCSSERMVVKHKGDDRPSVQACTLLAYDSQFNLGHTLKEAHRDVFLNHTYCAKFCVLGGASCSSTQ